MYSNKTKNVLVENELTKFTDIWHKPIIGQSYFGNNESQNFWIFQPVYKIITTFSGLPNIINDWIDV